MKVIVDNLMQEIRDILKSGGKSTVEIATIVGLPSRKISQTLIKLKNRHIVYTTNVPNRSHLWHLEANIKDTVRYKVLTRRWDSDFNISGDDYETRN